MRLQKYLASCGVASRRAAEKLMADGRVTVDGQVVSHMGAQVEPGQDVRVDGRPARPEVEKRYIMYHKPAGEVTTVTDPEGRSTVLDKFRDFPVRLYPVGRLDYDSEGLLLLTNDGDSDRAHAPSLARGGKGLPGAREQPGHARGGAPAGKRRDGGRAPHRAGQGEAACPSSPSTPTCWSPSTRGATGRCARWWSRWGIRWCCCGASASDPLTSGRPAAGHVARADPGGAVQPEGAVMPLQTLPVGKARFL